LLGVLQCAARAGGVRDSGFVENFKHVEKRVESKVKRVVVGERNRIDLGSEEYVYIIGVGTKMKFLGEADHGSPSSEMAHSRLQSRKSRPGAEAEYCPTDSPAAFP